VQQSPLSKVRGAGDLKLAETTYQGKAYSIRREPTPKEMADLLFGWFVEQGVTSNSVLYIKDECTVGIGTGEQDRVGVAESPSTRLPKIADTLCFDSTKCPTRNSNSPSKRRTPEGAPGRDRCPDQGSQGGPQGRGHGFGCVLPL